MTDNDTTVTGWVGWGVFAAVVLLIAGVIDPATAAAFVPPAWFGIEVGDNEAYQKASFALEGMPQAEEVAAGPHLAARRAGEECLPLTPVAPAEPCGQQLLDRGAVPGAEAEALGTAGHDQAAPVEHEVPGRQGCGGLAHQAHHVADAGRVGRKAQRLLKIGGAGRLGADGIDDDPGAGGVHADGGMDRG